MSKDSAELLREWTTLLFVEGRVAFIKATSHLSASDFLFLLDDMHGLMANEVEILRVTKKALASC